MKRILIIDESQVVRETLAFILGREFEVSHRALTGQVQSLSEIGDSVDLVILGLTPGFRVHSVRLANFAARAPFAMLFLADSQAIVHEIEVSGRAHCLTKPFNPYELKQRVADLLSDRAEADKDFAFKISDRSRNERYLAYPYVTKSVAAQLDRMAESPLPLLIEGELGCGQDKIADALSRQWAIAGVPLLFDARQADDLTLSRLRSRLDIIANEGGKQPVIIAQLERCPKSLQAPLLELINESDTWQCQLRWLATGRPDILEEVYQGNLLADLYYRLAMLRLRLSSLRDRQNDIPKLADCLARFYGAHHDLTDVKFTDAALQRLSHYYWFGNLAEMESVIARTLVLSRKLWVDEPDLIFDFTEPSAISADTDFEEYIPNSNSSLRHLGYNKELHGGVVANSSTNGPSKPIDLNVLIHELAHELKNPMVTIKTFAQLLGDRYQDEGFRTRFQEMVGQDIERMDELLEAMIEFADFGQPKLASVSLKDKIHEIRHQISTEAGRRHASIHWTGNGNGRPISGDEAQLAYAFKNIFLAVLSEAKVGRDISVADEGDGKVAITYWREAERMASITHYLNQAASGAEANILPLRMLLAKQLIEKNGGRITFDQSSPDKDIVKMEFPIAERGKEN